MSKGRVLAIMLSGFLFGAGLVGAVFMTWLWLTSDKPIALIGVLSCLFVMLQTFIVAFDLADTHKRL